MATNTTKVNYTLDQVEEILVEAQTAAHTAAYEYFNTVLGGRDQWACGFSWVEVYGIDGRSKLGKLLKQLNFRQRMWNPAKIGVQNVDTLYAGAVAAANVLKKHGIDACACSRLD